VQKAIIAATKS